jgi:hypothetical protein
MPPKGRKAAPKSKAKAASATSSTPPAKQKFTAADAKKLADLQKAQKAAQVVEEAEKKKGEIHL